MKVQKLLLPFEGKTMIEKVIENVMNSGIDNTMVVVGSHGDEIIEVIRHLPITTCYNNNYKKGMLSSVKCGVRSLPSNYDALLVFLGDQPMIPTEAVKTVIEAYKNSGKGIVIPTFEKRRGHPLLIDRKYREAIERLDEKEGLRALAVKFADDVLEVETNMPEILRDIDTREEYESAIDQLK